MLTRIALGFLITGCAAARFGLLCGLAMDNSGNLYAADQTYNVIRLLQPVRSLQ